MLRFKYIFLLWQCSLLVTTAVFSQKGTIPRLREKADIKAQKKNFHLYLLIGQSNMAGRGIPEPQDTIGNKRILRLNRDGDWDIAKEPLHFDKSSPGVGPGLAFAKELLKSCDDNTVIGLIPCAAGGSGIDSWLNDSFWEQTKSFPYNNAIIRTKLGMKDGVLKGILWNQGEADCISKNPGLYTSKLIALIVKIRQELKMPDLPFIAGELPVFNKCAANFNPSLYAVKDSINYYDVASGEDLNAEPDGIHLDAASARKMGMRYAFKMELFTRKKK